MTHTIQMHPHAALAIWAAEIETMHGLAEAQRFCQEHGVPAKLFVLARVLSAANTGQVLQQF